MIAVVKFNEVGRRYFLDTKNLNVKVGDVVIVDSLRGLEMGSVFSLINEDKVSSETKQIVNSILRIATKEDLNNHAYNQSLEPSIISKTKALVKDHNLPMKILNGSYTLDRKKLWIFYESETTVDFRDLLKSLAYTFPNTRVELRQVHTRDSAKILGGMGSCGYITCCSSFLTDFDSVTMKDAKAQDLKLNPDKLTGVCGKLLCCIKFESSFYLEAKAHAPAMGSFVNTPRGRGKVIDINYLSKKILVRLEEDATIWFAYNEQRITEL